jgi:hypothetical protein
MKSTTKYLLLPSLALSALVSSASVNPLRAQSRGDVTPLQKVTKLAIGDWRGDRGFRQRMQRDMSQMGFRFVPYSQAQAIVSARTSWKNGGFASEMAIRDFKGRVLWRGRAYRPASSGYMASDRLAASLRAALRR